MPIIYRKTARGVAEIETRALRLPPRMRSALILVDGRRSDVELRTLILQQPDETLATLAEQGFIEIVARTADAPPRPTANVSPPAASAEPAAPSPAGEPVADFETLRRSAVRGLNDQLGPMAETLAIRMERARSAAELRPLLATAAQLIHQLRGRAAAEAYAARFAAL